MHWVIFPPCRGQHLVPAAVPGYLGRHSEAAGENPRNGRSVGKEFGLDLIDLMMGPKKWGDMAYNRKSH